MGGKSRRCNVLPKVGIFKEAGTFHHVGMFLLLPPRSVAGSVLGGRLCAVFRSVTAAGRTALGVAGLLLWAGAGGTVRAESAEPAEYHIQSRWIGERFLAADGNAVKSGPASGDEARWILEKDGGDYLIRNRGAEAYLVLPENSDVMELVRQKPATDRGRWNVEPSDDGMVISNKATGKYVNIERLKEPVSSGLDKRPGSKNWTSGLWNLVHVGGGEAEKFYKKGQVLVEAPAYGSTIKGDTVLKIKAPGWEEVDVRSWLPGGRFGEDTSVGMVKLDAEGRGSLVFPADKFPHGPMTISVKAGSGKKTNNYYLLVYNEGGVSWNEGAPKDPPPAAKGMKLVFQDDFDGPELSISKNGKGATYMSHKPGGGDFSGIPFGDHENKETTPFSQRETYLRIRADKSKNTTGLLASVDSEGVGFTAKAPCYFECRFIAQTAPGTWPAFWVMTNYMIKDHDKQPLRRPADELDVIEAYGGEGSGTPNAPGYMIHAHYWNQGKDGGKDYSQDRFAGPIHMTKLDGGGGASWYETFHTYGVYVGTEETIYYCDDIEVARHKTARLSREEPIFFFVNLAIGGASGWKTDLSQYGGLSDMYVDYVRVYEGK